MQKHLVWWLLLVSPAAAQEPLTLQQAVEIALGKHPAVEAAAAQVRAAESRIEQARSGYLPKVSYSELFARSNNPVFVFSSLLTQRQFTERNFAIGPLIRPDFLNNFQSMVTVDQNVWDNRATRRQVQAAELGRAVSEEDQRRARLATIARVVEAYFGIRFAQASLDSALEALKSAEADLQRAESVRKAGMSTDADVLSIRVHLAAVREQEIRRRADLQVAHAALNEALGLPLDTQHVLSTALAPAALAATAMAEYEKLAGEQRPEVRQARLAAEIANTQQALARSALLPQLGVRGAFEADRQEFIRKGGANWLISANLRWNLFNGFADRARISEASHALAAAQAQARRATAGVRLEVRRAWAALRATEERIQVASAAVDMARESLRITKNRYDAGMATVTDLLRNETALDDAQTRRLGAIYEQRVAAAALEIAAGTLSETSEVLR